MFDKERLHHAYVLVGSRESLQEIPSLILGELGIEREGNPDLYILEVDSIGIDHARHLADRAEVKAFGERKVIIVKASKFTHEAQNALLKTLEEPPPYTHFFILVPDAGSLIPTLLSRVQTIHLERKGTKEESALRFLGLGARERLEFVKKFVDEERSLSDFLDSLLLILRENGDKELLKEVFSVRLYAGDRSASARLILEHLSLVL